MQWFQIYIRKDPFQNPPLLPSLYLQPESLKTIALKFLPLHYTKSHLQVDCLSFFVVSAVKRVVGLMMPYLYPAAVASVVVVVVDVAIAVIFVDVAIAVVVDVDVASAVVAVDDGVVVDDVGSAPVIVYFVADVANLFVAVEF